MTVIAEPHTRLRNRRFGRGLLPDTPVGLVAAGLALLLPVLTVRTALAPAWTPRYALLGVEAAVGLPLAFALLRTRLRSSAVAALGFAVVSTVSTLASDNPAMSFFGMEFWGTGLLFVLALVGVWALGACSARGGPRSIEGAILVGVAVNCVVVVAELFVDLSRFGVLTVSDQPAGLLGQPVALGAFLLGAVWLVGRRAAADHANRWLLALAAVAGCIELGGERLPLVLAPVVLLLIARRCPWRRAALLFAAAFAGLVMGWALVGVSAATPSATARLGEGDAARVENYTTALHAMVDRPLLGWGPGRYQAATSQYRTRAFEAAGPDRLYADAHNTPLQYGVTTGVVGLAFLGAWLLLAFRRATDSLAGFAALIMLVQLLQPQDLGLTPLAFLALGASAALPSVPRRVVPLVPQIAGVVVAAVFAGLVLVGGYHEWRVYQGSQSDAFAVAGMLPHWPERAALATAAEVSSSDGSAVERVARARGWTVQAINRDQRDVRSYPQAAVLDIVSADLEAAREHVDAALRLSPWSPHALLNLAAIEQQQGNKDAAVSALHKLLEVSPNDEAAQQLLASLTGK